MARPHRVSGELPSLCLVMLLSPLSRNFSYEVTPTYRLATRDNGFMKLSPTLDKALRLRLQEEAKSM